MKKTILYLLLSLLVILLPMRVNATVQVLDLENTLNAEEIEIKYENYEEKDGQIPIYLFRGEGCTHCYDFLEYLNSIADEHGYMFKLRSYEVYNNPDNKNVKNKIVDFFGDTAPGVPYFVIGKKTFYGYSDKYAKKVLNAIKEEYEAKEKYDVFDEIEAGRTFHQETSYLLYIIAGSIIILVVIVFIIIKIKRKK